MTTGQPRVEVRRGGATHPALAAGGGRDGRDDIRGIEVARSGCQRYAFLVNITESQILEIVKKHTKIISKRFLIFSFF
jgi:hypothetical protein